MSVSDCLYLPSSFLPPPPSLSLHKVIFLGLTFHYAKEAITNGGKNPRWSVEVVDPTRKRFLPRSADDGGANCERRARKKEEQEEEDDEEEEDEEEEEEAADEEEEEEEG